MSYRKENWKQHLIVLVIVSFVLGLVGILARSEPLDRLNLFLVFLVFGLAASVNAHTTEIKDGVVKYRNVLTLGRQKEFQVCDVTSAKSKKFMVHFCRVNCSLSDGRRHSLVFQNLLDAKEFQSHL